MFKDDGQKILLSASKVQVPWSDLKLFGPATALVWEDEKAAKMPGYPNTVTVERWKLEDGKRKDDILEISVKIPFTENWKKDAQPFFDAAKKAFGEPRAASKTTIVLDFFKPGH